MALRQTNDEQADFARALEAIADEEPLPQPELDSLSMLEGSDLQRFREVWAKLPAGARARLVSSLYSVAEQRLRVDYSAVNHLALEDSDPEVRLAGIHSAIEDRSPALRDRLLELIGADDSIDVRDAAAEDLARFTLLAELDDLDAEATTQLRTRLGEVVADSAQAPRVRGAALAALGYFSDIETAALLASAFTDPDLRLGAVRGMGRTADPRWTDRLMPVLGSDDPDLREEAARALGEIEDERAITPLVELVDDPEMPVRLAVIKSLGHIGGEEAREALLYLAEAGDDPIREAAEKALDEIESAENDPLDLSNEAGA
jgi:HEAT repeat protein